MGRSFYHQGCTKKWRVCWAQVSVNSWVTYHIFKNKITDQYPKNSHKLNTWSNNFQLTFIRLINILFLKPLWENLWEEKINTILNFTSHWKFCFYINQDVIFERNCTKLKTWFIKNLFWHKSPLFMIPVSLNYCVSQLEQKKSLNIFLELWVPTGIQRRGLNWTGEEQCLQYTRCAFHYRSFAILIKLIMHCI